MPKTIGPYLDQEHPIATTPRALFFVVPLHVVVLLVQFFVVQLDVVVVLVHIFPAHVSLFFVSPQGDYFTYVKDYFTFVKVI